MQVTENPQDIASQPPYRNAPRIAAFMSGDEEFQYILIVEQRVICKTAAFSNALFIMFSLYYIFHLEYPKSVKNVMFFLQDYVLGYPDSLKRPGVYLAKASDIKKLSK